MTTVEEKTEWFQKQMQYKDTNHPDISPMANMFCSVAYLRLAQEEHYDFPVELLPNFFNKLFEIEGVDKMIQYVISKNPIDPFQNLYPPADDQPSYRGMISSLLSGKQTCFHQVFDTVDHEKEECGLSEKN